MLVLHRGATGFCVFMYLLPSLLFISVFFDKGPGVTTTHPTYSIIPQHVVVVWGVT